MATPAILSLNAGKLLQIMFSEGIRNQLSRDFRDWDMVKINRVSDAKGRQLNYMIQTSYGPAAIQYRNANLTTGSGFAASANFPTAQRVNTQELTSEYKEIDMTVEIDYNLWNRLQKSKDVRYYDQLALELQSKVDAAKRRFGADFYADGTGVIATVASASISSGNVLFTLSSSDSARGFVGMAEFGDILVLKSNSGSSSALALDVSYAYWLVVDRIRETNQLLLQPLDASLGALTAGSINTPPTAGDVFYRYGQPTIPNLSSITDYGFASEVMLGLESLAADDARVVNGLTMSGLTAGSRYDAGGANLNINHIEAALNKARIKVGEGAYAFKRLIMAPESHAVFVASHETDRRFMTFLDDKRGMKVFGFQSRNDFLESYVSEYCPLNRVHMIPEARANQGKVIEFYGSDFEPVKVNDSSEFMLKTGSNGYERKVQSFMEAYCQLIVKHPAAIATVHNFVI